MNKLLLLGALLWALVATAAGPPPKSIVLEAVEDAYVVTDTAAAVPAEGTEDLRDKNFGSLDFVRVWYASKVLKEEQIIAVTLVKFDLAPIKKVEVQSATLQLFAIRADLAQPARLVDVNPVEGPWTEKEVTFNMRPPWGATPIATAVVYGGGAWYSWDVTGGIERARREGVASYVLGLRTLEEKKEEQVAFATREAGRNGPRLIVTYRETPGGVRWYYALAVGAGVAVIIAFPAGWWLARRRARMQRT